MDAALRRFRAVIAYDGRDFSGFQRLATSGGRSVQGVLEAALTHLAHHPIRVIGAGRTDAGVHASGQVIAFDLAWRHDLAALQRAINANLPRDVCVLSLALAADDFHPRYQAVRREYAYRVYVSAVRHPLLDRAAWQVYQPLDVARMNLSAAALIGRHDFASFGTPPLGERGTTVRTVFRSEWQADGAVYGLPCYVYHIAADAFLYRMVRAIVGMLVAVGTAQVSHAAFLAAFAAKDRGAVKHLAAAHGLTLTAVFYPD